MFAKKYCQNSTLKTSNMRIGIITHYYHSQNYGGNLQAYALCKFLELHGYDVEQICYKGRHKSGFLYKLCSLIYHKGVKVVKSVLHPRAYINISKRKKTVSYFNQQVIPHSKQVYNDNTLVNLANNYDLFITGSDQVWHPNAVCDAYLLDLKTPNLHKIAYAASVSKSKLSIDESNRYRSALSDFQAISVREEDAVNLISPLANVPVEWVVDPVFLLDSNIWNDFAEDRIINVKYLFCYFLGSDNRARAIASDYAKKNNLLLVTMPYLSNTFSVCDHRFGDMQLFDVSPSQLLSIIRYAECVFTDSFHIMAFSLIFKKNHFVFERPVKESMSSRIHSLANFFETQSHFCDSAEKMNMEYVASQIPINYDERTEKYDSILAKSVDFLLSNIEIAKENIKKGR